MADVTDLPPTRASLAADLIALGLEAGDTVLVHSSLRAVGWVPGGQVAVVQALLYVLETGCQWRHLPKDFPPRSTVWGYFDLWAYDGTLARIHEALYGALREAEGREASPTAAILDSKTVKSAAKGGLLPCRPAMTPARRQRASSATSSSTPSG